MRDLAILVSALYFLPAIIGLLSLLVKKANLFTVYVAAYVGLFLVALVVNRFDLSFLNGNALVNLAIFSIPAVIARLAGQWFIKLYQSISKQ